MQFTAAATGAPAPTVQWMVETPRATTFTPISGATSTTLNLGAATLGRMATITKPCSATASVPQPRPPQPRSRSPPQQHGRLPRSA